MLIHLYSTMVTQTKRWFFQKMEEFAGMRVAIFSCLYVLFTVQVLAAAAADQISWPDRGPYQQVGKAGYAAGVVRMPAPVVAAVRQLVGGEPSDWFLEELVGYSDRKARIITVAGTGGELGLLVARGTWTRLDVPASVPLVNGLLAPLAPADLSDHTKLKTYLFKTARLQRCLLVVFLDPEFWQEEDRPGNIHEWLRGTEHRPRALHALCRPWQVIKTGNLVKVRFNAMTGYGGVERWTVHLQVSGTVRLVGFEVRCLRESGTFSNVRGEPISLLHI